MKNKYSLCPIRIHIVIREISKNNKNNNYSTNSLNQSPFNQLCHINQHNVHSLYKITTIYSILIRRQPLPPSVEGTFTNHTLVLEVYFNEMLH